MWTPKKKEDATGKSAIGLVSHDTSRDNYALNMASGRGENTGFGRTMARGNFLVLFAVLTMLCGDASAEIRSVVLDKQSGQLFVMDGLKEDFVAWANFTDDIKASGWVDCEVLAYWCQANCLNVAWMLI